MYGYKVFDADGNVKIIAGQLGDGTYGLAAVNDLGELVDLAALAFGQRTASVAQQDATFNTATYADLEVKTVGGGAAIVGPSVDVLIGQSGRCKVTITAQINYSTVTSNTVVGGAMSFVATGPMTVDPSDDNALMSRLWNGAGGTGAQQKFKASYQVLLEGLLPGEYTFTCKYKSLGTGSPSADAANFEDRRIWVEPF